MDDDALLRSIISTPEGRRKLAESMTQPFRCGGLGYDPDGTPFYWSGGQKDYERARPLRSVLGRP